MSPHLVIQQQGPRRLTIPFSLYSVLVCIAFVCLGGFIHLIFQQDFNREVLDAWKVTYFNAMKAAGSSVYTLWTNGAFSMISLSVDMTITSSYPQILVNAPTDGPVHGIDLYEFESIFAAESGLVRGQRLMYLDMQSLMWTGNLLGGDSRTQLTGSLFSTVATRSERVVKRGPPATFVPNGTYQMVVNPFAVFQEFIKLWEPVAVMPPCLDYNGNFVFGVGIYVAGKNQLPVAVILQLTPLDSFIPAALLGQDQLAIYFDGSGGMLQSTYAPLRSPIVPADTPGALCTSAASGGTNITKCRHSYATVSREWSTFSTFFSNHPNFSVTPSETSELLQSGEALYIVSAQSVNITLSPREKFLWLGVMFTPADAAIEPYLRSSRTIIAIVGAVCGGCTIVLLLLTLTLTVPLRKAVEEMIDVMLLKPRHGPQHAKESDSNKANTFWSLSFEATEVLELRKAVEDLQSSFDKLASCLPPIAVAKIRESIRHDEPTTSSHHQAPLNSVNSSRLTTADESTSSFITEFDDDDQLMQSVDPYLAAQTEHKHHLERLLAFLEQKYQLLQVPQCEDIGTNEEDTHQPPAPVERRHNLHSDVLLRSDTTSAQENKFEVESILSATSIATNRSARRRSHFVSVSFEDVTVEVQSLLMLLRVMVATASKHHGAIEIVESTRLTVSFGCYSNIGNVALHAFACANEMLDVFEATKKSSWEGHSKVTGTIRVAVDCGWFESSTVSFLDSDGAVKRRQVVDSPALYTATTVHSLCRELNQSFVTTANGLRGASDECLPLTPHLLDCVQLKLPGNFLRISRRGTVLLFAVPRESPNSSEKSPTTYLREANFIGEGFHLMLAGNYLAAAHHFSQADEELSVHSTVARLGYLSRVFMQYRTNGASFHREEMPIFEPFRGEVASEGVVPQGGLAEAAVKRVVVIEGDATFERSSSKRLPKV